MVETEKGSGKRSVPWQQGVADSHAQSRLSVAVSCGIGSCEAVGTCARPDRGGRTETLPDGGDAHDLNGASLPGVAPDAGSEAGCAGLAVRCGSVPSAGPMTRVTLSR